MAAKNQTFRQRLAGAILGKRKDFIPSLNPIGGVNFPGSLFGGRINDYSSKQDQIAALTGWVHAANSAIVEPTAAVEIKLYRKMKDGDREEIDNHEILDLIKAPNAVHTGEQLRQLHFTYMNIVGESYIYMRDPKGGDFSPAKGKLPAALDIFPAHLVTFIPGRTYSDSVVRYNNFIYPASAFIRDINPDPNDPYQGRSIVAASAAAIDTDNQMKTYNQNFFANGARPSMIVETQDELSDESFNRLREQTNDEYAGTRNAHKPFVVERATVKPYMMSQSDLDFLNGRKFSRDEILAMFKVQPGMIGLIEDVNRSNLEAGFYVNAVINVVPRIRQFVKQLNATLVSVYDPTLELDYVNPVPEDVEAKLAAANQGVNRWWTVNEIRAMYGDKPLDGDLGDHIIVISKDGAQTLESIVAASDANDPDEPNDGTKPPQNPEDPDNNGDDDLTESPTDESKAFTVVEERSNDPPAHDHDHNHDEGKQRTKKDMTSDEQAQADARISRGESKAAAYNARGELYEAQMMTALRAQFEQQRQDILTASSTKSFRAKGYPETAVTKADKRTYLAALLVWANYDEAMAKALQPILFALIAETGKDAMAEISFDPSMFNPTTQNVLDYYQQRAAKIATDVNAETEKQLRATLSQGIDAGESDDELAARIENVMGAALSYRTDRIARTEVTRAQGFADVEAWKQSGVVTGKEWYCTIDERTCQACLSLDGTIVSLDSDYYSLGDVVPNGPQTLNISYDDVGTSPLHVSCRCRVLPVQIPLSGSGDVSIDE